MEISVIQEAIRNELDRLRNMVREGKGFEERTGRYAVSVPTRLCRLTADWVEKLREMRVDTRDIPRNDNGPRRSYDELGGKVSEEMCWVLSHITPLGEKFGGGLPDLIIRNAGEQRFDPDFGKHLHIKACSARTIFDWSWVVDESDGVFVKPDPKDIIVLCRFFGDDGEMQVSEVEVQGWVSAMEMGEKWCPTMFLPDKRAIYADEKTLESRDRNGNFTPFVTRPMRDLIRLLGAL